MYEITKNNARILRYISSWRNTIGLIWEQYGINSSSCSPFLEIHFNALLQMSLNHIKNTSKTQPTVTVVFKF